SHEVIVRAPTSADLAAIESMTDVHAARTALLAACIGTEPDTLPADVIDAIVARLEELDPQADVALVLTCPECAHEWREPFDIVTFFWNEVSVAARRLLGEVHELASAYHWSERDILALSPARRDAYLELVR
ncbi:MAG TPA: phage baseplate protein, partial [Thermoanaerobaculia bacterium]|nr:phage baseplate protein [Thermoanaerobaculia bacterium]